MKKNDKQPNTEEHVERLNRMPLESKGICERHIGSVQLFLSKERISEKKIVLFYTYKLHPLKTEGEIFTECLMLLKKYTQALGTKAAFRPESEPANFRLSVQPETIVIPILSQLNHHSMKSGG